MFVKDAWRADHSRVHPKFEVYHRLATKGVEHVATMLAGGDMGDQHTRSQEMISKDDKPLRRIHTRLVLKEIGEPIETAEDSRQFFETVIDAFEGLYAFFRCSRMTYSVS